MNWTEDQLARHQSRQSEGRHSCGGPKAPVFYPAGAGRPAPRPAEATPTGRKRPASRPEAPAVSEKIRQSAVVRTLRLLGYTVLMLGQSQAYVKCPCGREHWPSRTGNTTGTPDLLIGHPAWGNRWVVMEMKVPGGKVRRRQKDLLGLGVSVIIYDSEEAVRYLHDYERTQGLPNAAALKRHIDINYAKGVWPTADAGDRP